MTMALDVVYPVQAEATNEQLRYSLRSLVNWSHGQVWVIGHRPPWLTGVRHVPGNIGRTKWARANSNLRIAAEQSELSEQFVLMNDDFFIMKPLTELPIWHAGTLAEHVTHYGSPACRAGMQAATEILRRHGCPGLFSYELHVPMVMDREGVLAAFQAAGPGAPDPLYVRSLYGNLRVVGGTKHADVKVYTTAPGPWVDWPLLSTSDRAWKLGAVARWIRGRFPEPSPYESDVRQTRRSRPARPAPPPSPIEESTMSEEIMTAVRMATVFIDGRRRTIRRGQTAHAGHPVVTAHPRLWEPLRIDFPAPHLLSPEKAPEKTPPAEKSVEVDNAAVRAWAAEHGITVSPRGRLPEAVVEQYRAAHR